MRKVYWNGSLIPETEARVSIYDSALLFGDCIFEMTRSFNKVQFKLREHLERLYRSAKYLRINIPMTIDQLEHACQDVQEANDIYFRIDDEHRLMINITRGILPIYNEVDIPKSVNVIIADFPLRWTVQGMGRLFDTGINLVASSQRAIPSALLEAKVKNRSRIHYLMANIEASAYAGDNNWPILLDPDGFLAESSGSNLFIVKGKHLYTPEGHNCLRGISREFILLFNSYSHEKNLEPYDLYNADEAFLTATPFCMLPVTSFNGVSIGDGKPGRIYYNILKEWGHIVGVDIKRQIQSWDRGAVDGTTPYQFK